MSIRDFLSSLTSKSGKVTSGNTCNDTSQQIMQMLTGETVVNNFSSKDLINMNSHWVAICNAKNANTCASIPIHLYYKSNVKPTKSNYKVLSNKKLEYLQKTMDTDEGIVEIVKHPVLDLFKNINDSLNYTDFTTIVFQYLGLIGNSYVEIVREGDIITALNPLLSEYVSFMATGSVDGTISKYLYEIPQDKVNRIIDAENILQFSNFVPGNNLIGKGELEYCINAVLRYNGYDGSEIFLAKNNCRPDSVVFNWKKDLDEKEKKQLYTDLKKQFSGIRKTGKPFMTTGEVDIKTLGLSPKDMEWQQGRVWARNEICSAFGVPLPLVTTTEVNRANAVEASNFYHRYTIYPKLSRYCEKLNEQLIQEYDPNLFVWFSENYIEDPSVKSQNTISAYSAGIIDKNEARNLLGFEAVEEEDVPEGDKDETSV